MTAEQYETQHGTGRIITRFGADLLLKCTETQEMLRATAMRKLDNIACGDMVNWQSNPTGNARILKLLPRKNALTRLTYRDRPRTIASNIDQLLIVCAWRPDPVWGLVDRYLIAAAQLQADAVIIINKRDLSGQRATPEDWASIEDFERLGYPVLHISSKQKEGIDELKTLMRDKSNILVGRSGVGKSSIANNLMPDSDILTNTISDAGEGRHTTTTATWYDVNGGSLIDSPGVRDYMPDKLDVGSLVNGYREMLSFTDQCHFNNCTHNHEPRCAVRQAVDNGDISTRRYKRYLSALSGIMAAA